MNKTTKVLLALAGVIVLSYPGIAWVSGMVIESRLQHDRQQLLDKMPYLTLLSSRYQRGVYRSSELATYGLRMPAPQAMRIGGAGALPAALTITVATTIEHGPLPGLHTMALAVVDSTLLAPPALRQELSAVIGSKPILHVHTIIGYSGGATSELTSPAFDLHLADGSSVAWGGLSGTFSSSRDLVRVSGRVSAPRLLFAGSEGRFELTGAEYSGTQQKAPEGLYLGSGTFTIERLDGSNARSGGEFSLQRAALTSTSSADGDFIDIRVDVAMDAATIAAAQLTHLAYSESFEHVDGPALVALAQAMRTAQRQAAGNPAQLQAGMRDAWRQYGAELVLHDPVIDIRQASFTMPEGSLLFSARISAPGLSRADLQWPAVIVALRTHAKITADLKVDNGLLQKLLALGGSNPRIAAQLTSFEQQGYLTAGPAAVTTHLRLAGGRLSLNGRPFPPAPAVN